MSNTTPGLYILSQGRLYEVDLVSFNAADFEQHKSAFIARAWCGLLFGAKTTPTAEIKRLPSAETRPRLFDNHWMRLYARSMGKTFEIVSIGEPFQNAIPVSEVAGLALYAFQYSGVSNSLQHVNTV